MTQTAICAAAAPLLAKIEAVHQILFKTAHMAARSGLGNLRRELVRSMEDLQIVKDGLLHKSVQEELSRLQVQRDSIQAQPEPKAEVEAEAEVVTDG